jgi:chemotaxis signal transduction protein
MSGEELHGTERAAAFRDEFDRSFAHALGGTVAALTDLLAITVAGRGYLLRLADVGGLFADKTVTSVPSPVAELLGIAGFRGAVVPVFDLALLLDKPRAAAPRWLVIAAAAPVALAFESFDGHVRVPQDAVKPAGAAEEHDPYVREFVRDQVARPIIHLPSVLETAAQRCARNGGSQGPT